MDSEQDKDGMDIRQRKFGLPSWMVNNMERLNYATDFEQYGSSPPETEGFLAEHMEPHTMGRSQKLLPPSCLEIQDVLENWIIS